VTKNNVLALTKEYNNETRNRKIQYTIEENFKQHPDLKNLFDRWKEKKKNIVLGFNNIFHPGYPPQMFDIRETSICEHYGQRNALSEPSRRNKILAIAKNFDPLQFQPIDIDFIVEAKIFVIRDGGGRAHAAYLNGIYKVPATIRNVPSVNKSRQLFYDQDKNNHAISEYDKYLQALLNVAHRNHDLCKSIYNISISAGFCLSFENQCAERPLVKGLGILKRTIRVFGGDPTGTKTLDRAAPNLCGAISVLKQIAPNKNIFPASLLEAVTAFIYFTSLNSPSISTSAGLSRFVDFFGWLLTEENNLDNWTTHFRFESSNDYGRLGILAFLPRWNDWVKTEKKNIGNCRVGSGFHRFVEYPAWASDMVNAYKKEKGHHVFPRHPADEGLVC
jgi:hypothetical protein